jgi:N-acetylmuramoyl-L-alanine amidase
LNEDILEKDVNLAIARRLRAELQNRGVNVFMLRDGDQTISLDRRAETANALRPGLYLALHAASLGRGVRICTSALPPAPSSRSITFAPWATAQAGYISASGNLATALLDELSKNPFRIPVGLMPAPVRPLNNIAGAAVAIEVSPQRDDVASLSDPDYQQSVAVALATAIATLRPQLEQSR